MKDAIAWVYRGTTVESVHCGSVAVVNSRGKLLYYHGNPDFFTYLRSSAKPFQLGTVIQTGAAEWFGFTQKELAIIAGSHNGEPQHVRTVKGILKKIGLTSRHLQCGTQPPLYYSYAGILPRRGEKFSTLQHNCSGKHSAMLAASVYEGWNLRKYLKPEHPLQKENLETVAEICSFPARRIETGIDGCSAPNFALPLKNMAFGFARLVTERNSTFNQVKQAMQGYPEMVSGKRRLDFALSQVAGGKIVAKAGAEALECLGVVGDDIGVAVRVYDGNNRAVGCIVVEVLKQLGILKQEDLRELEKFARPIIKNFTGKQVGYIAPAFKLKKAQ